MANIWSRTDHCIHQAANGDREHYYFHLYSIINKNNDKGLKDYLQMIEEHKEEIAKRNEKCISADFTRLLGLLLSSCFIFDLFLKYFDGKLSTTDDPDCGHRWVYDLWVDLLHNQIPFFILEKVYEMAYTETDRPPLEILALFFFNRFVPLNKEKLSGGRSEVYHLLHLVHHHPIPSVPMNREKLSGGPSDRYMRLKSMYRIIYGLGGTLFKWLGREMQLPIDVEWLRRIMLLPMDVKWFDRLCRMRPIPTATRLKQAGVKFRQSEDRGFVVEFNVGVLELPYLHVRTTTKKFLRNLIAWEQCHRGAEKYFTNYAMFLYCLVNTSKDIEILIESGVLVHSLKNNEEVVQVFNSLSDNLVHTELPNDFLGELSMELNRCCQSGFNKWWAKHTIDYFGSPWKRISVTAAALIVLHTVLQSFFSVYSYFRPPQLK